MKLLKIDFNEIQKAMEDVSRDKFDYFLNLKTGRVVTISQEILERAEKAFCENIETSQGEISEEFDMPEVMEKEIELAVKIFSSDEKKYVRIPERESKDAYSLMKKFAESITELHPHDELMSSLNGSNSFSRFKKVLTDFPEYRVKWFAFNANAMKKTITEWLASIGIKPEQDYYRG